MELSHDLISQFIKATKDDTKKQKATNLYGTIVEDNGGLYVTIDGSTVTTPVKGVVDARAGDRVLVTIENHEATIVGNFTYPPSQRDTIEAKMTAEAVQADLGIFNEVMADKITVNQLNAINATIENLKATVAEFGSLSTDELTAVNAQIDSLKAKYAYLDKVSAKDMEVINAEIDSLKATVGSIDNLTTNELDAFNAQIDNLDGINAEFKYVSVENLKATYANIDFTNIGKAAMEYFYAKSGLIENVVVGDQTITGELIGVTISGDLIKGNTIQADKLVIKGEDGIYYKLNVEAGVTTSEKVSEDDLQNGLSGDVIIANTITAEKISVDDLVAFDATIAGFNITDGSLYSGTKNSVDNTTTGAYLDDKGQFNFGGDKSYLMGYIDDETGEYRIVLKAHDIILKGTNISIEEELENIREAVVDAQNTADNPPAKYATCSTGATTAAKVATLSSGSKSFKAGDTISVKFTNKNTALNPTLNVDSTGAKPIYTNGVRYAYWVAGQTIVFTYDGTNWQVASAPVYANTVTVGNSSSNNVYIDSDSVDIRKASTSVATFSESKIDLGINSQNSVINFCEGNGSIRVTKGDADLTYFTIKSNEYTYLDAKFGIKMDSYHDTGIESGNINIFSDIMGAFNSDGMPTVYPIYDIRVDYSKSGQDTTVGLRIDGGNGYMLLDAASGEDFINYSAIRINETPNTVEIDGVLDVGQLVVGEPATFKSIVDFNNHIYIPNGKIIYTYDSNGDQAALVHANSSNRAVFGHGFYNNGVGETYIYSNNACRVVTKSGGLLVNGYTVVTRTWTTGTVTNINSICGDDTLIICKYNTTSDEAVFRAYVSFTPTSAVTSGSSITICKLPSSATPVYGTAVSIYAASTNARRWMGLINTDGEVIVRPNSALEAGTKYGIYIYQMYRINL